MQIDERPCCLSCGDWADVCHCGEDEKFHEAFLRAADEEQEAIAKRWNEENAREEQRDRTL